MPNLPPPASFHKQADEFRRHKKHPDASDMFDTPHLLGVAYTGPYLHDGRAKSLEELWTTYQTNDLHGVSSYMNKHQLNELVEYLKTL